MGFPSAPTTIDQNPPPADPTNQSVRQARLAERRRQIGLQGRMSTFLTDYQGQRGPSAVSPQSQLLGG